MKAHQDGVTTTCKLEIAKGMNMGLLSVLDNDFLQWPTLHCQFSFCSLHSKNFLYVFSIHQASKTCRNSANGILILPVIVFLEVLRVLLLHGREHKAVTITEITKEEGTVDIVLATVVDLGTTDAIEALTAVWPQYPRRNHG